MAVLAIFITAVLCIGAVSAATVVTIDNTTTNTVYVGMTVNSTNSTAPGDTYYLLDSNGNNVADNNTNICCIIEKPREFQKNIYFCFIDYAKAFDRVNHNKLWKIL